MKGTITLKNATILGDNFRHSDLLAWQVVFMMGNQLSKMVKVNEESL